MYRRFTKRFLDVFFAILGLLLMSPIFVILAVIVKMDSRGQVFFKQQRVGKGKVKFVLLKFRTMKINAPSETPTHQLINSEEYITKSGKVLRRTGLDEIPQLINIIKGNMSIVDPRPALWNQYDLIYERDKYCANDIRPGLTGWAQINGRDELSIDKKAMFDGDYTRNYGFIFDMKIVFKTLRSILVGDGFKDVNK